MGIETNKQRNNPEINQSWKIVSPTGFEPASTAPLGRVKNSLLFPVVRQMRVRIPSEIHFSNFDLFQDYFSVCLFRCPFGCYQFAPKRYNLDKICFRILILYFRGQELYLELFLIRVTVNWLYTRDTGEIRNKLENFSKSK